MRLSERTQKWILVGVLAWLLCGVAPSLVMYAGLHSRSIMRGGFTLIAFVLGIGVGGSTLGAVLVHPKLINWPTLVFALIWFALLPVWLLMMGFGLAAFGAAAVGPPPNGAVLPISGGVLLGLLAIPISALISASLLWLVTRSKRVFLAVIVATACLATVFVPVDALRGLGVYLWCPIVAGSLIVWAIDARLRTVKRYLCVWCGYDRRGLDPEARCPECGNEPFVPAPG